MKTMACGEVVPGCDFEANAQTDEELMRKVAAHASEAHGVREITPELAEKVKAAIRAR